MKNNKSINIYMGIIGEAYVDKETAYAVLLAAKKNILDVQAIIEAANALRRPLTKAQFAAQKAITDSVDVYNKLKTAIASVSSQDAKYLKLYALLTDLNENDFDDNFSNGGNIFTARENLTFAQSLESEINEILVVARDLLDANKLNAVVRCKEYNIAKELFEAMIPEKIVSPEDISDTVEAELLRRINAVRNNIDYVNLVSDEISSISGEVSDKIDDIVSGADEASNKITNETLYWYAGNINPNNEQFMSDLGFTFDAEAGTYVYKETLYNGDGTETVVDADFGIDGPLRANKWFHQPLHLIQEGQLIAGVDGGKAKYASWFVAVPRYIPTAAGLTAYVTSGAKESGKSLNEWAVEWRSQYTDDDIQLIRNNYPDTLYVDSLYPCKPQDYEHTDDVHGHPIWDNTWDDLNGNNVRDEGDENKFGYKKITKPDSALSINGIIYDVWETPVTIYNKQRLNVYFNFGIPSAKEVATGIYWYIGKNKPTYESDVLNEEGWHQIENAPTAESPITYSEVLDSKIFYVAIPKGFGIFNEEGVDLTNPDFEAESPYTLVYTTLIGKNTYNVYITGNEDAKFFDKIYVKEGKDIEVNPDEPEDPDTPKDTLDVNDYLIYIGTNRPNANTNPNDDVASNNRPLIENTSSMGWRSIGSDISAYNALNPAFDGGDNTICVNYNFDETLCYLAIPEGMNVYDGLGNPTSWNQIDTITIGGHQYKVLSAIVEGEFADSIYGGNGNPGGETGGEEPEPVDENYYIFIGTEVPANIDPVNNIVAQPNDMGWRGIGADLSVYNSSNKAFDGGANTITLDPEYNDVNCVLIIPTEMNVYDGMGTQLSYNQINTITIGAHQYKVLTNTVEGEFGFNIY